MSRDFTSTLDKVQTGFRRWAMKPHNKKWVRLIDGTPIENDVCVVIAELLCETTPSVRAFNPEDLPTQIPEDGD